MSQTPQFENKDDNFRVIIRARPLCLKQKEEIQAYEQAHNKKSKVSMSKVKLSQQAYAFYLKYFNANIAEMINVKPKSISVYDQEYKNTEKKLREYFFSHVHNIEQTNLHVFQTSLKNQISSVMEGYNFTILAYGITGSGKTYSIFGHPKIEEDQGICLLIYKHLFEKKKIIESKNKNNRVTLRFSFIQIYNQVVKDLLSEDGKKQVIINEDSKGNVSLGDVFEIVITSLEQVSALISQGSNRRIFASTNYNQVSSRSHAILKLNVEIVTQTQKLSSKLYIIDLAGSEKIQMQNSIRKQEGININKSLLSLGNCITALAENTKRPGFSHIPYRDSKLTRMLKDSLGGNAKTIMIGCISPNPFTIEETITTLNYAEKAQGIKKDVLKNGGDIAQPICSNCFKKINSIKEETDLNEKEFFQTQQSQIDQIFNDMIERIYSDIIENVKEGESLAKLAALTHEPLNELEKVKKINEEEGLKLKQMMFNVFHQKKKYIETKKVTEEPISTKKKKIRISNSLKKDSREKIQKQNVFEFSAEKIEKSNEKQLLHQFESGQKKNFSSQEQLPLQILTAQKVQNCNQQSGKQYQSAEKMTRRKSRSKFEIVKKPVSTIPQDFDSKRYTTDYS